MDCLLGIFLQTCGSVNATTHDKPEILDWNHLENRQQGQTECAVSMQSSVSMQRSSESIFPRPSLTYQIGHAGGCSMQQKVLFNMFRLSTGTTCCPCPAAVSLTGWYSCVLISAPPVNCLMANCSFNAFDVSAGTGVPQQIQAIQVHPNTTNSDSSPETSHTSTNSTGRLTMGCLTYSGLMKIYI